MGVFAALDVSQEETAICAIGSDGTILAEGKVSTCPDAIVGWLRRRFDDLERVGMETHHSPLKSHDVFVNQSRNP